MVDLKNVSKPESMAEAVSAGAESVQRRLVNEGSLGGGSETKSRAEDDLMVAGKSEPIVRPTIAVGALETVIGVDQRERILETDLAPWRMICALRMRGSAGGGGAIGSGWLAGPRTVITAGHCVHHEGFFGGWANTIDVSAGRNGTKFPFDTVTSTRFSSVDRWVSSADPDFDIGAIHLSEPLGDETGWFGYGALTPDELEGHLVNVSGYPGDRGNGTEQLFHVNRVLSVTDRRIFYDVDTAGGQSGCPVFVREEESSPPLVVGIHAYGIGGTPAALGVTANSSPRIIPEVFDQIAAWVESDNSG